MLGTALLLVVLLAGGESRGSPRKDWRDELRPRADWYSAPTSTTAALPLFSLLAPGSSDQSAVADLCDTYAASMTGAYWCLRGDGTQTGATLTATGSPVTETRSYCGNGSSCGNVTGKRFATGGAAYYTTASVASPAGSFTVCATVATNSIAIGALQYILAKRSGQFAITLYLSTAGVPTLDVSKTGSVTTTTAAVALTARARHFVCGRYTYVSDGASLQKMFTDGVTVGTPSTTAVGPVNPVSQQWGVAANPAAPTVQSLGGVISNAFFTETALDDATILAMSNTALGKLTPATGQTLTYTRSSSATCQNTSGSELTVLPPNRPCITQSGGPERYEAATNTALRSEELDNATWTKEGGAITANGIVSPDGTTTMDKYVEDSATSSHRWYQGAGAFTSGNTYFLSFWVLPNASNVRNISAMVNTGGIEGCTFNPNTGAMVGSCQASDSISCAFVNSSTPYRCTVTVVAGFSTGSGFIIFANNNGTALGNPSYLGDGVSGVAIWGVQLEVATTLTAASPYIPTTSASVNRTVDVFTVPNPLSGLTPTSWCYGFTVVTAPQVTNGRMFSVGNAANANTSNVFRATATTLQFRIYDNSTTLVSVTSPTGTIAGSRYVLKYSGGTMTPYRDGVAGTGAASNGITTWPATAYLGALGTSSTFIMGAVVKDWKIDTTTTGCD